MSARPRARSIGFSETGLEGAMYQQIEAAAIPLYLMPRNFWWLPLGLAVLAFAQFVTRACALRAAPPLVR